MCQIISRSSGVVNGVQVVQTTSGVGSFRGVSPNAILTNLEQRKSDVNSGRKNRLLVAQKVSDKKRYFENGHNMSLV